MNPGNQNKAVRPHGGNMTEASCAFCGRSVDQVSHLIQGPTQFICDICVDACIDTLARKDVGWRERQIDYLLRLRHQRSLDASAAVDQP